jgi:hypothetical protein
MEQENIFPDVPTEKVFKPIGIFVATFFGGPLVAGYLISSNYRALKERNNVVKTWVFAILGTILIIAFSNLINTRSTRHIPGYLFPIIYSTITYSIVNLVQKDKLATFISSGGAFHTSTRIFVITIIGLVITLLGLMIIANIFDYIYAFG